MPVEIKCSGKDFLPLEAMTDFQGGLKSLSEENYQKLKRQIEKQGFIAPFFVWKNAKKNYILDGHQRDKVLRRMNEEGAEIPDKFPVVYIQAETRKQAKEILLALNSQYGKMTEEGLFEFVGDMDLNFDDIMGDFEFPAIDFDVLLNRQDKIKIEEETEINKPNGDNIQCPKCGFMWIRK